MKLVTTRHLFSLAVPLFLTAAYLAPLASWIHNFGSAVDSRLLMIAPKQLWTTIIYSSAATAIAVALGGALAIYHRFLVPDGRRWLSLLVCLSLFVGFIARNFAWLAILGFIEEGLSSVLGVRIYLAYSAFAVVLVMTSALVPLAFFVISNGLRPLRDEQLEAAQVMGVAPHQLFRAVIVPIALRSASLAFLLILAIASAYFVTPRILGGGKVDFIGTTAVWFLNHGDSTFANQLGLTLLVPGSLISASLALLVMRWRGRQLGF